MMTRVELRSAKAVLTKVLALFGSNGERWIQGHWAKNLDTGDMFTSNDIKSGNIKEPKKCSFCLDGALRFVAKNNDQYNRGAKALIEFGPRIKEIQMTCSYEDETAIRRFNDLYIETFGGVKREVQTVIRRINKKLAPAATTATKAA